jgi:hypothetical protein
MGGERCTAQTGKVVEISKEKEKFETLKDVVGSEVRRPKVLNLENTNQKKKRN